MTFPPKYKVCCYIIGETVDCGTLAPKAQKRQPPMAGSWRNITHRHNCGWWNGTIVLALGRSGLRQQTGFF